MREILINQISRCYSRGEQAAVTLSHGNPVEVSAMLRFRERVNRSDLKRQCGFDAETELF